MMVAGHGRLPKNISEIIQKRGHLSTKKEWKPCCEDFRLTMESYGSAIKKGLTSFRFSGHRIDYCPYCGKKLEV